MMTAADEAKYLQPGVPTSNGKLAMWLFLVTEIMFFTGLIGTYVVLRMGTPEGRWPKPTEVHLSELLGAINTFVLIFSSFTVVLAHSAMARKDVKKCLRYIGITFVCGWVFMGIKAYEYSAKFQHGIMPGHIGDNLIDPALKNLNLDDPAYRHFNETVDDHGKQVKKYQWYVSEAGKHPYDPNAALAYKNQVKAKLMAACKPALDEIKAMESAAADAKKTVTDAERQAIVGNQSEMVQKAYALLGKINGDGGQRPITPLEVGVEANELGHKYEKLHLPPYIPYGNLWSSCYFAMTGFHAAHVLGGIVIFAIILIMGARGKLDPNPWNTSLMELTGLYWHFVDVVWIFLFPLLYLV